MNFRKVDNSPMTTKMEYMVTKEECAKKIRGVCSQCGGELEPIETVDNSRHPTYWSGCVRCSRFDCGVLPLIYSIAKELVEECGFKPYSHIRIESEDNIEVREYKINCQIGGACAVVNDVLRIHNKQVPKLK